MGWFEGRYRGAVLLGIVLAAIALYALFISSVAKNEIIFGVSHRTATIISVVGFILVIGAVAVVLAVREVRGGERDK